MGTKESRLESDFREPMVQKAGVLSGCHWLAATTRKQPLPYLHCCSRQVGVDRVSSLLSDLEPDGSSGLPLLDSCALTRVAMGSDILDTEPYEVAGPKFAIHSEVEERQISKATFELKARPDRPDMLWLKRWLRADKLSLVPRTLQRSF